jgi:hypothetical protein
MIEAEELAKHYGKTRALVRPLPGIWPALHLDTAVALPIGVEAYAALALPAWLTRDCTITARTRRFAKWSAICSLALGIAGRLPPDGPGRDDAAAVDDHYRRVLPAGPDTGHRDRAGAHAANRRRDHGWTGDPDRTTIRAAVSVVVPQGPRPARPQTTGEGPGPVPRPGPERRDAGSAAGR